MNSEFGEGLIQAATEALAHARGEDVPGVRVHEFPDPREVRRLAKFSQEDMAQIMGMRLTDYREWEDGQRSPSATAWNLLRVLAKRPDAAIDALKIRQ